MESALIIAAGLFFYVIKNYMESALTMAPGSLFFIIYVIK
jgi:hypothetical protein